MAVNKYVVPIYFYVDGEYPDGAERVASQIADTVYKLYSVDSDIGEVEERD